jgi:Phosphotransferase enzyme family
MVGNKMNKAQLIENLTGVLSDVLSDDSVKITDLKKITTIENLNNKDLGTELLDGKFVDNEKAWVGFNPIEICYQTNGGDSSVNMVIKGAAPDTFVRNLYPDTLNACEIKLQQDLKETFVYKEFENLYKCEYHFYQLQKKHPIIADYTPKYYGHFSDKMSDVHYTCIALKNNIKHLNEYLAANDWPESLYESALLGIGDIHACFIGDNPQKKDYQNWVVGPFTDEHMNDSKELWLSMFDKFQLYFPNIVNNKIKKQHIKLIDNISTWLGKVNDYPKTLIHGDFNPRNLGFEKNSNQWKVVILDWECVRWGLPQYDIAQFLLYACSNETILSRTKRYVEFCRQNFNEKSSYSFSKKQWQVGFKAAIYAHMIDRAILLGLVCTAFNTPGVNLGVHLYNNCLALLPLLEDW